MKPRIPLRNMLSCPNYDRAISIDTLHTTCRFSIFFYFPYHTRCLLRVAPSKHSRQYSVVVFYLLISPHWSWGILQLLFTYRNMKHRSYFTFTINCHGIFRLCSSVRSDEVLGGNRYHKPIISCPIHRNHFSRMVMRGVCCR